MTTITTITVTQLAELHHQGGGIDVVDVRTPVEFREIHAVCAQNVPLDELNPQQVLQQRRGCADSPIYLICKSGGRSAKACEMFVAAGITNIVSVEGGTSAWAAAGLPVSRGKKAILPLERQVRTLAGFLALLGAILGYFVHPYFNGLSAFIGAGLMYAGITDTCGMGMMLAKMPWNKCQTQAQSCRA